jgi:hypothetical protein
MTAQPQARPRADRVAQVNPATPRDAKLPTRPRRLGQWAAAVLFVLVSMLLAAWVWQQQGDRVEVLVMGEQVPAGHVIERSDLATASVAGVSGAISIEDVDNVVGSTAAVALVPGQVLTDELLTTQPVPADGQRIVGVDLDTTRAPLGLGAGDVVTVLAVPPSGDASDPETLESPTVLSASAEVFQVDRVEGGGTRLSLVVPDAEANRVAAFGAAGRIAVVQAPVGTER